MIGLDLPKLAVRGAVALAGLAVLAIAAAWVVGLGPFAPGKSAAEKLQPKVEKAVARTTAGAARQGDQLAAEAKAANTRTERRAEAHVTAIRRTPPPRPPRGAPAVRYAEFPDRQFYAGVCDSVLYRGDPACGGERRRPEGGPAAGGAGALRGR